MVDGVTVCLTSCGRKDLLIQTINSFYKYIHMKFQIF